MGYKYKPSKSKALEFAKAMREVEAFCTANHISQSLKGDSYYFALNGVDYRVSNHTVEASNKAAYDEDTGVQMRELYHDGGREKDTVYIFAGKTRIIEIYNDLAAGHKLDARGYRV